jgi:hypothetical protein
MGCDFTPKALYSKAQVCEAHPAIVDRLSCIDLFAAPFIVLSLCEGEQIRRTCLLILSVGSLCSLETGCSSVANLGMEPFGSCDQTPGLIYGGLRSDVASLTTYPIWGQFGFLMIPARLAADAVGDTITLPYILARQGHEWVKSRRLKPSPHQGDDVGNAQASEAGR